MRKHVPARFILALVLSGPFAGCDEAPFAYDTSQLAAVDAAQISHREVAAWRVSLPSPRFLAALPDGRVVVVGGLQGVVLDSNGVAQATFLWRNAGMTTAVAAAPDGSIYVGTADRVVSCGVGGTATPAVWDSLGENARITGLAADTNEVWVCDAGQRKVWRFDHVGCLLGQVPPANAPASRSFVVPSPNFAVATIGDGTFWVVNPGRLELQRYSADGKMLASWTKPGMTTPGLCSCCNPAYLALLPDGSLVTSEKKIARVKIYSADGTFRSVVATPTVLTGEEGRPIAVDRQGRVLVLDGDKIRVFVR